MQINQDKSFSNRVPSSFFVAQAQLEVFLLSLLNCSMELFSPTDELVDPLIPT